QRAARLGGRAFGRSFSDGHSRDGHRTHVDHLGGARTAGRRARRRRLGARRHAGLPRHGTRADSLHDHRLSRVSADRARADDSDGTVLGLPGDGALPLPRSRAPGRIDMIGRYLALRRAGVLGLNGRNARYIAVHTPRRFYPLVDDQIRCKELLRQHGIPVPALLDAIRTQFEAGRLGKRLERLEQFAIKPACGSQGNGIIVIGSRRNGLWLSPSGSSYYSLDDLEFHVSGILNGLYSLGGQPDAALL